MHPGIRRRRANSSLRALVCASGLVAASTLGLGLLYSADAPSGPVVDLAPRASPIALLRQRAAVLDPSLTGTKETASFARTAPLRSHFVRTEPAVPVESASAESTPVGEVTIDSDETPNVADLSLRTTTPADPAPNVALPDIPLPLRRPASAGSGSSRPIALPSTRYALRDQATTAPVPPTDGRTLLERMFGAPTPPTPTGAPPAALAYATPGDPGSGFFGSRGPIAAGTGTAVYNIARHTVTLPDGLQLEAHSGLGVNLDNPGSVTQRMRGATPPSLYDLTQREALFHGVRALRLTPLLAGTTFGRGGLLAHTFMLGPRGDSNGCVVFKDYAAFLAAYDSGKIRRLLVVAGT